MTKLFTLDADLIDWELLSRQKSWLAAIDINDRAEFDPSSYRRGPSVGAFSDPGEGILAILDWIQDAVVAQGLATEEEIFGFSSAPMPSQLAAALAASDNDSPMDLKALMTPVNQS